MRVPRPKLWHLMALVAVVALVIQAERWRRSSAEYRVLAAQQATSEARSARDVARLESSLAAARDELARVRAEPQGNPNKAALLLKQAEDAVELASLVLELEKPRLAESAALSRAYARLARRPWERMPTDVQRILDRPLPGLPPESSSLFDRPPSRPELPPLP